MVRLMKPFEIFRTGRHTSSQGAALTFSAADLKTIVDGYDPSLHQAPIVVGHPKTDDPAYGWVAGLSIKGDRLVATPSSLDAAFSDLVKDGKFRARSAAFYAPDAANNPTPGSYYLRHVGFLGAAAPAVKGLKPVEFGDDTMVVEFEDNNFDDWRQIWSFDAVARLFRGLRDYIIQEKDVETADKVVSQWDVDQIAQAAADMRAAATREQQPFYSEQPTLKEDTMTQPAKTAEQRAAELDAREQQIAARETTFAESERKARATADAAFVDTIVTAGRLPIGLKATATALFADLGEDELTFADGEETKKMSPRAAFRDLLEKLPIPVVTDELAKGDAVDFADVDQVTENFDMQFVAVDQDEAERIAEEIRALPTEAERAAREHDQIVNACRDWRQVTDDDNNEIPFSAENLLAMLKSASWYRAGIYASWVKSLVNEEARRGN